MLQKKLLIGLASFLTLLAIAQVAKATTITSATLNKDIYLAVQTGHISVTMYNDKSDKIRITDLSATIDYYYEDGTIYIQKFFTNADLPVEIPVGQSEIFRIPISLPTNLASGYIKPNLEARTDIWLSLSERWIGSDRATHQLELYVESPYEQLYETSQQELQNTQQQLQEQEMQLQEQETANKNLTNTNYMLVATTMVFAATTAIALIILFARKPRPTPQT